MSERAGREELTFGAQLNGVHYHNSGQALKRVLVADDDAESANTIAALLSKEGYEVVGTATDGAAALSLCETRKPDLAVINASISAASGIDALDVMRQKLRVPVLILSSSAASQHVGKLNQAGVYAFLMKPVDASELHIAIQLAWARHKEQLALTDEIRELKERLENRKIIEQAKWLLVQRRGLDEPEAMKQLQKQARNNRRPLVEVAKSVIESAELLSGPEIEIAN
ncbi:MAG TPA: response regulator [Phycisphaerales bacterium]|nr:response regulator [Phycisphaerales bacterium]